MRRLRDAILHVPLWGKHRCHSEERGDNSHKEGSQPKSNWVYAVQFKSYNIGLRNLESKISVIQIHASVVYHRGEDEEISRKIKNFVEACLRYT
ncbi:hypothetical protein Trydic_g16666 [Trypoxylus dichotomus]